VDHLVVVALGGNAIADKDQVRADQQEARVRETAQAIVEIVREGHHVCVAHGNGPQVGTIFLQQQAAASEKMPAMPLDVCGAMSQGMIGFWLQQSLQEALTAQGLAMPCATVVTQTLVRGDDVAFRAPSKPIGPFYTKEEAEELTRAFGYTVIEDVGRGYRRVVPSPRPQEILEFPAIRLLIEAGCLVVAAGGGGVPVLREQDSGRLQGVEAVVDKDLAAATLADQLDADTLLILTAVPFVAVRYGQPTQEDLRSVRSADLERLSLAGEFAPGSMLPKVQACIGFVRGRPGRRAIITSIENAVAALHGLEGTQVVA